MPSKNIDLVAGTRMPLDFAGEYFRLLTTVGAIDIEFRRKGITLEEGATGIEAGFGVSIPGGFDRLEMLSATTQTIKLFYGNSRVAYDRSAGTVSVTGTVDTRAARATVQNNSSGVSVGTSTIGVTAALASRTKLIVRARESNTADIWLGFGVSGITTSAIRLAPGETWIETDNPHLSCNAISTAAGQLADVARFE